MERKNYETWWDRKIVNKEYATIDEFKKVLDRNKSRYEYLKLVEEVSPKSILDVGCGLGQDYEMYKKEFPTIEYHGIDICEGFIEENKRRFPEADFRVARIQDLPFEDNSIDLVTCRGVLEHIPEPEPAIKEMTRVTTGDIAIIWFLIPQKKEQIKITQSGFYRNIYSEDRIMKCLDENKLLWGYDTEIPDNKSPMKKHELWVLYKEGVKYGSSRTK